MTKNEIGTGKGGVMQPICPSLDGSHQSLAPLPALSSLIFLGCFSCSLGFNATLYSCCWAEAHIKITRMTLTIKRDRNWNSFQLANSAPPLSVTDSAIAPSARMERRALRMR